MKSEELGNCYEKSFHAVTSSKYRRWTLVHGIITGTGRNVKGKQYGHAWIESPDGETVMNLDPTEVAVHKSLFYAIGNVKHTKRYDNNKASIHAVKTGHYGPWDSKIWAIDDKT